MLAEADVINSGSGIALGVVITIVVAAFTVGKLWSSVQSRLTALEGAQKKDNEWRSQNFAPWRSKVDRFIDLAKLHLGQELGPYRDPDAAQSRGAWPKTDDH